MRTNEHGWKCPETLGEYRDLCEAVGIPNNAAVKWLEEKIAKQGRDQKVIAPDSQVRGFLMPMLAHE